MFFWGVLVACEEREEKEQQSLILTGELTSFSGCKNELKSLMDDNDKSDSLSCIKYSFYETNSRLFLTHVNAAFNCCPESLYVKIALSGDTIIIEEFEIDGSCDCNCLYDLEIELGGVSAKAYYIKSIEPYNNEEELFFDVDLSIDSEGEDCVTRTNYPWGVS